MGRPVYLKLRSRDVVHSLYLPSYRFKIDAIPGSTTRAWFQAVDAGRTELGCAQYCGVSHYKMSGLLIARPEPDYRELVGARRGGQPAAVRPGGR